MYFLSRVSSRPHLFIRGCTAATRIITGKSLQKCRLKSSGSSKRADFFKKRRAGITEAKVTKGLDSVPAYEKALPLSSVYEFPSDSDYLNTLDESLSRVEKAVEDIKSLNDGMTINKLENALEIKINDTMFSIAGGDRKLTFMSPESGVQLYVFSEDTKRWVGETDGHDFEGLFVRDLMRHAYGIPNFDAS
mmetsp:Transcript_10180/g.11723  ORF Transcript_10180/g.11723 Transcript_10180/m.11723 type:complete len:191 (+) Transcript_10180:39-611(+)